jgi:ATP diphosphatase
VERALTGGDTTPAVAHEIGDLLFAVVNVARHLRVDPERELRTASHRFRDRFLHVEQRLAASGRSPSQATLEEMDLYWEEAKRIARGEVAGEASPGEAR